MTKRIVLIAISLFTLFNQMEAQLCLHYGDSIDGGWGSSNAIFTPYVSFSQDFLTPYAGSKIKAVRIGLVHPATNVYLYIKANAHDTKPQYRQKVGSLDAGWNTVTLDSAFTVTGSQPIAIGYRASFTSDGGAGYSLYHHENSGDVYQNGTSQWTSISGSFCIEGVLEGDNLPQNQMRLDPIAGQTCEYGDSSAQYIGYVFNSGANAISSYEVLWQIDDEQHRVTIDKQIPLNGCDTFTVNVTANTVGKHSLTFTVDKVNGAEDSYMADNSAVSYITIKDPVFRRRVLCEEVTGLWCGFCPHGMVGMQLMKDKYPGYFIAASIHWNDSLAVPEDSSYNFTDFYKYFSGAPGCLVDRKGTGDPFSEIQRMYSAENSSDADAALSTSSAFSADGSQIEVNSEFFTAKDIKNADWNIAYILTEDSVAASKELNGVEDYPQTNYYAGGSRGYMYGWENKSAETTDFYFDDLARGVYSSWKGASCYQGDITAMQKYTVSGTFRVPPTVLNKKNLHVIAVLIDNNSGYVVNAATSVPAMATSIKSLSSPTSGSSRYQVYTLDGVRLYSGQCHTLSDIPLGKKGMYLVRIERNNHVQTIKICK